MSDTPRRMVDIEEVEPGQYRAADWPTVAENILLDLAEGDLTEEERATFNEVLDLLESQGRVTFEALTPAEVAATGGRITRRVVGTTPTIYRPRRPRGPLPQSTFQEVRRVQTALADGPSGRRWEDMPPDGTGMTALRHLLPNDPHEVKLTAGPGLNWFDAPTTPDHLRDELQQTGFPCALLAQVCVALAIRSHTETVALDDLIRMTGKNPRPGPKRDEMRRLYWRWLRLLECMEVHGARPGKYTDRKTKKVISLTSRDPLLRIMGLQPAAQAALDGSAPPLTVTLAAGAWVEQFRGNRDVLSAYADVLKIAEIPAGKPSGEWAQRIGIALQQRWRESSAHATVKRVGEDNHATARFQPFTRRALFDMYDFVGQVQEMLDGNDPGRAKDYWTAAIKMLKTAGAIGFYKELDPLPSGYGWQDAWLNKQRMDIRPGAEGTAITKEIRESAARTRKRGKKSEPEKS